MAHKSTLPKNNLLDPKDRKWKIDWIKGGRHKTHIHDSLHQYNDQQLNDVIREIVQSLIRQSEIIASSYINGYR
jgi:hypothetical protein